MTQIQPLNLQLNTSSTWSLPTILKQAGPHAQKSFFEFFTAHIRNPNTRAAYAHAVREFFTWLEDYFPDLSLPGVEPMMVAAWVEHQGKELSAPTVKQHLAAVRMLFNWLVVHQVIPHNPAAVVRGPKHVVKKGKTPALSAEEARALLNNIPLTRKGSDEPSLVGLRDRALIGAMVYSFARVSAIVGMNVGDYYPNGKRYWLRLHEKGGKFHELPAHHKAEEYLDAYIEAAGIDAPSTGRNKAPLFRSAVGRTGQLSESRMSRNDVLRMIKRRTKAAEIATTAIGCHTFRATGITAYLENGGTIEKAQAIAAHESPRTTKLYDRTGDELTLDEIEKIGI